MMIIDENNLRNDNDKIRIIFTVAATEKKDNEQQRKLSERVIVFDFVQFSDGFVFTITILSGV